MMTFIYEKFACLLEKWNHFIQNERFLKYGKMEHSVYPWTIMGPELSNVNEHFVLVLFYYEDMCIVRQEQLSLVNNYYYY